MDGEGLIGDDDKKVPSKPDAPPSASTAQVGEKRKRDGDDDGDDPDMDKEDRPPSRKRQETPPRSISVFITEMLENGDLFGFICAVSNHRELVPNAVLWRFFLCCKCAANTRTAGSMSMKHRCEGRLLH
jgi:hypothetical protein